MFASACSSFGSNDASEPSGGDAGDLVDASAAEDGHAGGDAAADAGRPAPGAVVTVRKEGDATRGVAVTAERIYWWSVQYAHIASVSKSDLGTVRTDVDRTGQTVTAVGADASGIYWLEAGPDAQEGGTSDRIMKQEGGVATVLLRTETPLRHLAVSPGFVFSTAGGALAVAPKAGGGTLRSLGIDQEGLTADATYAYYTYSGSSVYRTTPAFSGAMVISGLGAPHSLATDSTNLYAVITDASGNAIVKMDKSASSSAAAATIVTRIAPGPTLLAVDSAGIVWGNADDGKIQRVARSGGEATVMALGVTGVNALVADGDGVYWTTDEGVVGWAVHP